MLSTVPKRRELRSVGGIPEEESFTSVGADVVWSEVFKGGG